MPNAPLEDFRKLITAYLKGQATQQQAEAVEKYYDLFSDQKNVIDQMDHEQIKDLDLRLRSRIAESVKKRSSLTFRPHYWYQIAAILVAVMGMTVVIYRGLQGEKVTEKKMVAVTTQAKNNRFVLLPDGSKVVLREGSSLKYGDDFGKTAREVSLRGEAYFDVTHVGKSKSGNKTNQLFIIRTSDVTTTVLGTAFTVKAWPDQKKVTVTVTRGKVKVENGEHQIAILTPNKQVSYDLSKETVNQANIKASSVAAWVQEDMTFDEMALGDLTQRLEKRYHIRAEFKNPSLKQCQITGRFAGTETLEEISRILSATSNASFVVQTNVLVIDGQGCN